MTTRRPEIPTVLLAIAIAASAALLLSLDSRLTFRYDDWAFLLYRPGWSFDIVMLPHNEHISILPILAYKALIETAGTSSALSFHVLSTIVFEISVVLMFALLRERVGGWLALAAALPVLFLGSASEDLLWSFQVGYFASTAFGLGAYLALERNTRGADIAACAMLVGSVASSSVGLAFAVGLAVAVGLGPRARARAFVAAIPLALYVLWWLKWGHTAPNDVSIENLAVAPSYILDGFSWTVASFLGLAGGASNQPIELGRALALVGIGYAIFRLVRTRGLAAKRWALAFAATGLTFWLLAALNANPARTPETSRYQYMAVVFALLFAAELARGARLKTRALVAVFAVAGLAVAGNVVQLHDDWLGYRSGVDLERADLAALEIGRDVIDPNVYLEPEVTGTPMAEFVKGGLFLPFADAHGSPGYSAEELADASEPARGSADKMFALGYHLAFDRSAPATTTTCRSVSPHGDEPADVELPPGGAAIFSAGTAPAELTLRRYATEDFPINVATVSADDGGVLRIPTDRSDVPWTLGVSGGPVRVCGVEGL